tara:strand:- start:8750 stop:9844 length:1095 start_codon:yes stop_codon:yes gene_type:complete
MPSTIEAKLRERVKELSCLYDVSSVLTSHQGDLKQTFQQVAAIVKNAWFYADDAIAEIVFDTEHITTENIRKQTVWLEEQVQLSNQKKITIRVHYAGERFRAESFLKEERSLLKQVAIDLADFLNSQFLKEQEERLKRGLERNDRIAILGEITAGIAHELNTPLANILGFAELLDEKTKDKAQQHDVQKIIKSAIYAREVVKKLMFFTCDMPQNREDIAIKPLIEEALSLLGPNLKKAGIEVIFNIDNEQLSLRLDRVQFMQLIFNLMSNAIYVSPEGSTILIQVFENNQAVHLEVADEGVGIPAELHSKVFEPFFSTKPPGQGSGLGLSVVHGIVKSHQGTIEIKENHPKGTIFSIQFPKEKN